MSLKDPWKLLSAPLTQPVSEPPRRPDYIPPQYWAGFCARAERNLPDKAIEGYTTPRYLQFTPGPDGVCTCANCSPKPPREPEPCACEVCAPPQAVPDVLAQVVGGPEPWFLAPWQDLNA